MHNSKETDIESKLERYERISSIIKVAIVVVLLVLSLFPEFFFADGEPDLIKYLAAGGYLGLASELLKKSPRISGILFAVVALTCIIIALASNTDSMFFFIVAASSLLLIKYKALFGRS